MSVQTCSKWVARYRAEGPGGLLDRAPNVVANRTGEQTVQAIAALRRLRFTGSQIADLLDRPLSTISGVLTRIGMASWAPATADPRAEALPRSVPGRGLSIRVLELAAQQANSREPVGALLGKTTFRAA